MRNDNDTTCDVKLNNAAQFFSRPHVIIRARD